MTESIEIIHLYDDLETDGHKLHCDDENGAFSVCIISCIKVNNGTEKLSINNKEKKYISKESAIPHKIKVNTRTSLSRNNYIDQFHLADHLIETVILTLPNQDYLSALLGEKPVPPSQSTQTEDDCVIKYSATYPNIFFCTFHRNGDVETLCNLNYDCDGSPEYTSVKKEDLEVKNLEKNCTSLLLHVKKEDASTILLTETDEKGVYFNAGSPPINGDEISNINKKYSLRNSKERKIKKWNDMFISPKCKYLNYKFFKCMHCPNSFSDFKKLAKHSKSLHNSTSFSFKCEKCLAVFTRPHNLIRHIYAKHADGLKKVLCDICGRRFSRQDVLITHKRLIHPVQNQESFGFQKDASKLCKWCNRFFHKYHYLKTHQSGNLKCSKCAEVYMCKTALKIHMDKDHIATCSVCGKTCVNERQLKFHMSKHSPKYKCKYCDKGFSLEYQLVIHQATHTGDKPLICEFCGRTFAHKNSLVKHNWQEHIEANKKFKCTVCGRGFVYKAKLENHTKCHSENKPFACHICPSSFLRNCSLATHIKSIHGVYVQSDRKTIQCKAKTSLVTRKVVKVLSDPEVPLSKNSDLQSPERNLISNTASKTVPPKVIHFRSSSQGKKETLQIVNKTSDDAVTSIAVFSII